jgi:hypothetical protein
MSKWVDVFVIVVSILIIITIILLLTLSSTKTNLVNPTSNSVTHLSLGFVELNYSCQPGYDQTCGIGLSCDATTQLCKSNPGELCVEAADCANGYYCSGLCVTGPYGPVNNNCPCDSGLLCVTNSEGITGLSICKINVGGVCYLNDQCINGICGKTGGSTSGICTGLLPEGEACLEDFNCAQVTLPSQLIVNQHCSLGYCQQINIVTGAPGSYCDFVGNTPAGPYCNTENTCLNNRCLPNTQTFGNGCGLVTGCVDHFTCIDELTSLTCGTTLNCICELNINDVCSNGLCMGGSTCVSGVCIGLANMGCEERSMCVSNNCNIDISTIMTVQNSTSNTGIINSINGSTGLNWVNDSYLPNGVYVKRLMGYTNSTGENLYMLSYDTNIYSLNGGLWTKIINGQINLNGAVIIDSSFTEALKLVLVSYPDVNFAVNNIVHSVVYEYISGGLVAFNVIPKIGYPDGVQYYNGNEIFGTEIDVSGSGDVLLNTTSSVFVLPTGSTGSQYVIARQTSLNSYGDQLNEVTMPRFYFDIPEVGSGGVIIDFPSSSNISFIAEYIYNGIDYGAVLQFVGNIQGVFYPNPINSSTVPLNEPKVIEYSIFSPVTGYPVLGMRSSTILMIVYYQDIFYYDTVIIQKYNQFSLQGNRFGSGSTLVTSDQVYLSFLGTCM